jgi:hypothetical protein
MRDGTWYLRRAAVTVTIGAPILPEGSDWTAAVRLRDAVRAEILRACGEPDLAEKPTALTAATKVAADQASGPAA